MALNFSNILDKWNFNDFLSQNPYINLKAIYSKMKPATFDPFNSHADPSHTLQYCCLVFWMVYLLYFLNISFSYYIAVSSCRDYLIFIWSSDKLSLSTHISKNHQVNSLYFFRLGEGVMTSYWACICPMSHLETNFWLCTSWLRTVLSNWRHTVVPELVFIVLRPSDIGQKYCI